MGAAMMSGTLALPLQFWSPDGARGLSVEGKLTHFATVTPKRRTREDGRSVIAILVASALFLAWLTYVGWIVLKARSLM